MPQYGEVRVDFITYTTGVAPNEGNVTVPISGLINAPTFSGDVVIEGGLTVSGLSTFNDITVTGDATIGGDLTVSGDINASGVTISGINGLFASGTEAAPSISFVDDTDTGLYSPSANEVAISTNGTARLFVDASGSVRVDNDTSPELTLRNSDGSIVSGDSLGALFFATADVNISGTHRNVASVQALAEAEFVGTNNARTSLVFSTNGNNTNLTEKLRITSDGKVGVGTSSPSANLHVLSGGGVVRNAVNDGTAAGTAAYTLNSFNGAYDMAQITATQGAAFTNPVFKIRVSDTSKNLQDRLTIDSSGRLGVGTTSPGVALDVNGNGSFLSSILVTNSQTKIGDNGVIDGGAADGNTQINFFGGKSLILKTGAAERARIDSSGNVGVGTATATSITGYTGVTINNATNGGFIDLQNNGSTTFRLLTNGSVNNIETRTATPIVFLINTDEKARIDSSGRLLVGTSSARTNFLGSSTAPIQSEGTTLDNSAFAVTLNANNDISGTGVIFARSRGTSNGGVTLVGNNAPLGALYFNGADGSNFVEGARIQAFVDGTPAGPTPGPVSMPGRLVFSTTADGASSPTERVRIDSTGVLQTTNGVQLNKYSSITNNVKMVLVTGDGGTNTVQTYWNLAVGSAKAGGCLGAYKAGTYYAPTATISESSTYAIYGFIDT